MRPLPTRLVLKGVTRPTRSGPESEPAPALLPRLIDDVQLAAYLSLPLSAARRVKRGRVRINGRLRWDRLALDRWLDAGAPPAAPSVANDADPTAPPDARDDPTSCFDRFLANEGHAAGLA